jgi:hypothetical protein
MRLKLTLAGTTAALILLAPSAAQAGYTISPPSLSFPDTFVDQKSAPQTITYSIDAAETNRSVTPYFRDCAPGGFCAFEFTTTCPTGPLPPGNQSCTFSVVFTPYLNEPQTDQLNFFGSIRSADLSGRGINPPSGGGKKKKKCKKKGKGKSAQAAKKKCGKKKKKP